MKEIDAAETLKILSDKVDELSDALGVKKNKAVEMVKGKPFAYIGGAFAGGLVLGYLMSRRNKCK
jgi:ElaB/YqjD/DUF883 family membrane-anchored ribosome-binding protein